MRTPPHFDPYDLLGVDASSDDLEIDRAYKARIRLVHPDVAGEAGLIETKRLNMAREWLLDPELRARLPRPSPRWSSFASDKMRGRDPSWSRETPPRPSSPPASSPPASSPPRSSPPRSSPRPSYDPMDDDPLTFDYGSQTDVVRALFKSVRALTNDERARVTYSMGDEPPGSFAEFKEDLGATLWSRSRALHDAVSAVWEEREDEIAPYDFPRGRFHGGGPAIANAYAQWLLLGEHLRRQSTIIARLDHLAYTCMWPWEASVGQPRYGSHHAGTSAFLRDADALTVTSAERLARSWQNHMGGFVYGKPGEDWFPGATDHTKPDLVSARLAAVDASRVQPPVGLRPEDRNAFHGGLRLTAYVLALGGVHDPRRDYLRPWKDAMDASPSFWDRARYGMPLG